jgi:hypothetical protein
MKRRSIRGDPDPSWRGIWPCHGVEVVLEEEDAGGRTISQALEGYASARDLDMLVMGAYSHSRVRDLILDGATNSMVLIRPCRSSYRTD